MFDESAKHVELKQSDDMPGEVEHVKNVDVISTAKLYNIVIIAWVTGTF